MLLADSQVLQAGDARRWVDLCRRRDGRGDQARSSLRAGRECRFLARHPARQPGHARHPLGLRVSDRWRVCDGPGRGRRDLARRRGIRHQLRRAADAVGLVLSGCQAAHAAADGSSVRQDSRRYGPRRQVPLQPEGTSQADDRRRGLPARSRSGDRGRRRTHGSGRLPGGRRSGLCQPAGLGTRLGPMRDAGIRQSLPGGAGRRGDLRRACCRGSWGWKRI
jgi:hypothetical protein